MDLKICTTSVLAFFILTCLACSSGDAPDSVSGSSGTEGIPSPNPAQGLTATEAPALEPTPGPTEAPRTEPISEPVPSSEAKLSIQAILLDAPLVMKAIDRNGNLPSPDSREEVVVYDLSEFGASNGDHSGNVVLSGYYDAGEVPCYGGYVPPPCFAVFGSLEELQPEDEIILSWDGMKRSYRVASLCWVGNRTDFTPFLEETSSPAITMMTAGGNFNEQTGGYSHTLLIRAVTVPSSAGLDCGSGSSTRPANSGAQRGIAAQTLTIDSASSITAGPGAELSITATTDPGAGCGLRLLTSGGRRILGFQVDAGPSGNVMFNWRVPDHYPAGPYDIRITCGSQSQVVSLVVQ